MNGSPVHFVILDEIHDFAPEPVTVTEGDGELPHALIVSEVEYDEHDPEWDEHLEVQHPEGCPRYLNDRGHMSYACHVDYVIENVGLREYFRHQDEPVNWTGDAAEPLYPGTYTIEAWTETYSHWETGPEYNDGLRLVDPGQ